MEIVRKCTTPMSWSDAICYADRLGFFIPNKRECKELGEYAMLWTSTLNSFSEQTAYVNGVELPQPMSMKYPFVMLTSD